MAESILKFNTILESHDEKIDLITLSNISKNFSEDEINSFRSNRDSLQAFLDDINPEELNDKDLDAVINLAKMWTHLVCSLFYVASSDFFNQSHLEKIVNLPDCEEDNGRSDSCFGAHFFVTLQKEVSNDILEKLLRREHSDSGFFPWLVARNPNSSAELLSEVAEAYTDEYSWRVGGYYTNDDCLIEEDDCLESFVLFQIAINPNTSRAIKDRFSSKIEFLEFISNSKNKNDLSAEEIQKKIKTV